MSDRMSVTLNWDRCVWKRGRGAELTGGFSLSSAGGRWDIHENVFLKSFTIGGFFFSVLWQNDSDSNDLGNTLSSAPGASNYSGGFVCPSDPGRTGRVQAKCGSIRSLWGTQECCLYGAPSCSQAWRKTLWGVGLCRWSVREVKSAQSGGWRCSKSTWRLPHFWNPRRTSWFFTSGCGRAAQEALTGLAANIKVTSNRSHIPRSPLTDDQTHPNFTRVIAFIDLFLVQLTKNSIYVFRSFTFIMGKIKKGA